MWRSSRVTLPCVTVTFPESNIYGSHYGPAKVTTKFNLYLMRTSFRGYIKLSLNSEIVMFKIFKEHETLKSY